MMIWGCALPYVYGFLFVYLFGCVLVHILANKFHV